MEINDFWESIDYQYFMNIARKKTGNDEDATDLLHDTIVRLFNSKTWCNVDPKDRNRYIAGAMSMSWQSGYGRKLFRDLGCDSTKEDRNEDNDLSSRLLNETVDLTIESLPPLYRDTMLAYILADCSIRELCRLTGTNRKLTMLIIRDAKQMIKQRLNL